MTTQPTSVTRKAPAATGVFERVLVGVDRSREGVDAARQAAVLVEPEGALTLFAAWAPPPLTVGLLGPAEVTDADEADFRAAAEAAVANAQAVVAPVVTGERIHATIVRGLAWSELVKKAKEDDATLLVVGSHGQGRISGILVGSTATEVVHKAPCSVMVARRTADAPPRRIVVGVDGSPESAAAYAAASRLADRFGSELWPVVAHGGKGVDKMAVAAIVDYHHEDLPDEPVRALTAAAVDADLVVLGSRGLHGVRALGSVSERVAHEARCSTLIVRGTTGA